MPSGEEQAWKTLSQLTPEDVCSRAKVAFDELCGVYLVKSFLQDILVSPKDEKMLGRSPTGDFILNEIGHLSRLSILWYLINAKDIPLSKELVVLLTTNSEYSSYVQQEIGFAKAKDKLVIPLVQPGVSQRCLAMLEGAEYIPFDTNDPELALSHLLSYLIKLKEIRERDQAILMGIGTLFLLALLGKRR